MKNKKIKSRNREITRARILNAAESCFCDKGFAGASMRIIAETASVHQSLIHHHFGSKDKLWKAVSERARMFYLEKQTLILEGLEPSMELLKSAVESDFKLTMENPALARLSTWEVLEGRSGAHLDSLHEFFSPLIRTLQKKKLINSTIEPLHLVTMIAASTSYWLFYREDINTTLGKKTGSRSDNKFLGDLLAMVSEKMH